MNSAAERLFQRQLGEASDSTSGVDLGRLSRLVVGAYAESDNDRRRTDHAAKLMAVELEESVETLQAQNMRFSIALDNMKDGLSLFGRDGRLVVCNRRQREILHLDAERACPGCTCEQLLRASPMLDEAAIRATLRLASETAEAELHQGLLDGREVRIAVRPTADGGCLISCEDVTERNRAAARIAFLAYHDTLTELPNRALLRERLAHALQAGACAVLCLDLDGFKSVNDTLGHAVGDGLLRAVTARLRQHVREGETLARLGGDEFAVVIVGGLNAAIAVAKRMVKTIAADFDIDGHRLNTGTSIGIAVAPADGLTGEELLRNADIALYCAKAEGRGCFRSFEPSMSTAVETRRTLEQDLRVALRNGQFELHYQPQIRVTDGKVISFEALLRWKHPERGMISPAVFIPIAEESGLIVKIGEWVLGEACREAARWPGRIAVAVNVSAVQIHGCNLFDTVASALQDSGLSPDLLEIEVTESAMLKDSVAAMHVMHRLQSIGIRVAMDDFGTGYSSLNYLQSFPFDRIKIDRSFVSVLESDNKAMAIVRAVTGLANSLGIAVTAEGVETHSQLDALTAEHCSDVQGFLYSRAVPALEVSALLEQFGFVGQTVPGLMTLDPERLNVRTSRSFLMAAQ